MALALIYIFATAKPFSTRRLAMLFVSTLLVTTPALEIFRIRNARSDALVVGAWFTLFVWSIPVLQVVRDSLRYRALSLAAFRAASAFVLLTYAFVLSAAPIIALSHAVMASYTIHLALLLRLLAVAGLIAFLLRAASIAVPFANTHLRGRIRSTSDRPKAAHDAGDLKRRPGPVKLGRMILFRPGEADAKGPGGTA